ncbi:metallophosphoesterase family protein [Macrococcoides canis]|uniref:metallophosphoesterase family protein n=1 Tax=Macrococcoides canis TaxID=1855823 RepID=UPI00165D3856|nr:DNA repair exonuclease [Macrococcus canis]QNR08486.1 DNA repair exonuclease [Macrococcus canis]
MIKFIHCSDIRLDEPFQLAGDIPQYIMKSIRNAGYKSLKRVVDDAIDRQVDFIIISGNLFSQKYRNIRADYYAAQQFERLKAENIYVYYIHGIEDNMSVKSFHKFPDNVITFGEDVETYELVTKGRERVRFHGFSYKEYSNYEYKLDMYPVNEVDQSIHIGLLNGLHHQMNTEKAHTEFHIEELNRKMYHYWALGGYSKHVSLNELAHIHYPGKLQANRFDDDGETGYLYVEGDSSKLSVTFIPVNTITFNKAVIKLASLERHAIYQNLQAFKDSVRHRGRQIYQVTLRNEAESLVDLHMLQKVTEQIQLAELAEEEYVWIDDITVDEAHAPHTLREEFSNMLHTAKHMNTTLAPLQHTYIQKFIEHDDFETAQLIDRGEIHLKMLMKGEQHED